MGDINLLARIERLAKKITNAVTTSDKASKSKFGIVKVGNGIDVSSGVISVSGSSSDYSTTEKKVGKWVDNSDVYEITFATTDTAYTIANTELVIGNIPNLKRVVSFIANISTSDKTKYYPLPDHQGNTLTNAFIKKGETNDVIFKSADTWASTDITIIVRYTKNS